MDVESDIEHFRLSMNTFLDQLSKLDRKLSVNVQKKIIREAIKQPVRSLRAKIKSTYKQHTGDLAKSVKSRVRVNSDKQVYATWGFRNKGLPERLKKNGGKKVKPAWYGYVFLDQGRDVYEGSRYNRFASYHKKGTNLFNNEFHNQMSSINNNLLDKVAKLVLENAEDSKK